MRDLTRYRPNVGCVLFNDRGQVWLGRRAGTPEPWCWQFPQGGMDEGETAIEAAVRELYEETGARAPLITPLGAIDDWLAYDFPPDIADRPDQAGRGWIGQKQKWFAFRWLGTDADFDLDAVPPREFETFRWEALAATPALIIPWKRAVYEVVAEAFGPLAGR